MVKYSAALIMQNEYLSANVISKERGGSGDERAGAGRSAHCLRWRPRFAVGSGCRPSRCPGSRPAGTGPWTPSSGRRRSRCSRPGSAVLPACPRRSSCRTAFSSSPCDRGAWRSGSGDVRRGLDYDRNQKCSSPHRRTTKAQTSRSAAPGSDGQLTVLCQNQNQIYPQNTARFM